MPEIQLILGASVLLFAGIVAQGLAHFKVRGRWFLVTTCLRAAAAILLASAWILVAGEQGQWTPCDLRQGALGLALAALTLLLAWSLLDPRHLGIAAGGLAADLVVSALGLLAMAVWPGAPVRPCIQRALPFWAQWGFTLLGLGATVVAASAGLTVLLHTRLPAQATSQAEARPETGHGLLRQASLLALVFLGSGLLASAFWSWRTVGALDPTGSGQDQRMGWMASTWLLAAASHLAWQLRKRPATWAAVMALLAASVGIVGLLALPDLLRLLGL
jgi:hypothetical protein